MVALVAALGAAWLSERPSPSNPWTTPTGRNIAQVVRGAATVDETLLTPPQAYRNVRITAAEMSRLSRMAQRNLAKYYIDRPLANYRVIARGELNAKDLHWGKTGAWMSWWRVDWVHLGELVVRRGSATATGSMEARSNRGVINRVQYTWYLLHLRSGWRIDRETWEFVPGYGP